MNQRYRIILLLILGLGFIGLTAYNEFSFDQIKTKEQLGEKLFFDPILSLDSSISCASCHKPEYAFGDNVSFSVGVGGQLGTRNTPTVMNMSMRDEMFWDGRAKNLEAQVIGPIENPVEMNLKFPEAVKRVQEKEFYRKLFVKIFGHKPDSVSIIQAIAAFERTLETDNSPNDRWLNDIKNHGMSEAAIRGRDIFMSERTACFECHFTPDFTNDEYRNIGTFDAKSWNDSGRYVVTKNIEDIGRFKVPQLRNLGVTAPYMHNGKLKTLREVIDYYDDVRKFIPNPQNVDEVLPMKIGLTELEKADLEAFLLSLTDDRFKKK